MHSWLVPHVVFPLWERLSGRTLWTQAQALRTLQWRSAAELEERALGKLRRLLEHARTRVPYYRTLLADVDPSAIRTVEDLARVPVTTKADLRRVFPDGAVADNLPTRRRRWEATSGSTGEPFEFYLDRAGDDAWLASFLFFLEWAGTAPWHTQVMVGSGMDAYRRHPGSSRLTSWLRRVAVGRAQVRLLGPETSARLLRDRVAGVSGPYFIWAYASYAVRLAREMQAEGIVLPRPPRVVVSVAETMATPTTDYVAKAFGCPVVRHYSCREIPRIAQTCPDRGDRFHVNSERAIVRIVRSDGGAAAPGERGRLLVTDLGNEVMPFINYDLGDTAVAGDPCDCGRGLPAFRAIEGRTSETIALGNGRHVSAATLQEFLLFRCGAIPHVAEYQAVQRRRGVVELRIVPTTSFSDEFARRIVAHSGELLGPDTVCRIVLVEQIGRHPSGKRLTVRSEMDPAQPEGADVLTRRTHPGC